MTTVMTHERGKIRLAERAIATADILVMAFSIYRLGFGWLSYDSQFEEIKKTCAEENKNTMVRFPPDHEELLRDKEKLSHFLAGEDVSPPQLISPALLNTYCRCVSDRARRHVSHFDVMITVASYG